MKSSCTKMDLQSVSYAYEIDDHFKITRLSIKITENTITALIGKNGCGKTTLLLLMMGYLKPSSGSIRFRREEKYFPIEQSAGKIAYLPQNEIVSFKYTVDEFLLLGRVPFIRNISQPCKEDYFKVEEVKNRLDIVKLGNKKLEKISGGELQRVRIGRALVQEAEILLFDEPITHLDIGAKSIVFNLMKELKKQGKTILFSSHDPLEAFQVADNSILIERNKGIIFGPTYEVLNDENLSACLDTTVKYGSFNGQKFLISEK